MKRQNILNCSFSNWYPLFRRYSIDSRIIKLPEEFIEYLLADGVVLPGSDEDEFIETVKNMDLDDEETSDSWSDDEEYEISVPKFCNLEKDIKNAITALGGSVFPKLNWSAPRDASWITPDGTLKCRSFQDICLLLKSSDFIAYDLTKAFECCEDSTVSQSKGKFELVLRRWIEISPAMEFRCFVKRNQLIAISQRDYTNFYDFVVVSKDKIHKDITNFFKTKIQSKFMDEDFVFDVYRYKEGCVQLIDINPFSKVTDGLLFSWQEIYDISFIHSDSNSDIQGEMRVITSKENIQPSPYLSYSMPRDIDDIASGGDTNKLVEFLKERNS